ncbi:hypothetical protein FLM9_242 [Candidatus Synechococcus spongiarum]|uniref:Uncharacterized protein n=1 Tax=Candidatus Synechococcus spongiarum TaxID=431041 RepID=A0A171DF00_9SYNE|nr:hypothetical protein FLM9_242 [Candidatus Synechococcus spongiarum]
MQSGKNRKKANDPGNKAEALLALRPAVLWGNPHPVEAFVSNGCRIPPSMLGSVSA